MTALTHTYVHSHACIQTLTRVRACSHTCMHIHPCLCVLKICLQALTHICAHLNTCTLTYVVRVCAHACVDLHTPPPPTLCVLTHVHTVTYVCAHTRVRVYTGGLILQTSLCRGSASPWLELPEILWNRRRLFLLPLHPHVDHPLSWQPARVLLSALVFPLPQVTSRVCPTV